MRGSATSRAPKLFISYRVGDTGQAASRLFADLAREYGHEHVFIDHEGIDAGTEWTEHLRLEAEQASVMLVLIGEGWLRAHDPETFVRRLDQEDDWVRKEIETALAAAATVVPVLVDDARPVDEAALKTVPSLAFLSKLQGIPLRRKDWKNDIQRLQAILEKRGFVTCNPRELSDAITYIKVKGPDFANHCKFFLNVAQRDGEVGFHHGFSTLKNEAGQALINLGALEYTDEFQSKRVKSRLRITKLGEEFLMYLNEHAVG